jgi:putative acetyltransferase
MIDLCLNQAREYGYEQCYIETMSYMKAAQKLYRTYGFEYLEGPIGDTGHYSCGVHMILDL